MTTQTQTTEEIHRQLRSEMYPYAIGLLQAEPVMLVSDFEQALFEQFKSRLDTETNMESKNRKRWQNMVDWVKAALTQSELIQYFGKKDERSIVYLPIAGYVNGKPLYNVDDVHNALTQLFK